MNGNNFESDYRRYEQRCIQKARQEFEQQSSNNKVQYLKGVYRHLLLSRLFASKNHTVTTIFENRYHNKLQSSDNVGIFLNKFANRVRTNLGNTTFEVMKTDVLRTLCDIFPDEKAKGGQFMDSVVDMDIMNDPKFGLRTIGKGMLLDYVADNELLLRNQSEAQQALAPKMSEIKKKKK